MLYRALNLVKIKYCNYFRSTIESAICACSSPTQPQTSHSNTIHSTSKQPITIPQHFNHQPIRRLHCKITWCYVTISWFLRGKYKRQRSATTAKENSGSVSGVQIWIWRTNAGIEDSHYRKDKLIIKWLPLHWLIWTKN